MVMNGGVEKSEFYMRWIKKRNYFEIEVKMCIDGRETKPSSQIQKQIYDGGVDYIGITGSILSLCLRTACKVIPTSLLPRHSW